MFRAVIEFAYFGESALGPAVQADGLYDRYGEFDADIFGRVMGGGDHQAHGVGMFAGDVVG